jgi:hypothetical protein
MGSITSNGMWMYFESGFLKSHKKWHLMKCSKIKCVAIFKMDAKCYPLV